MAISIDFGEELNGGIEVFHHDADVVHAFDRHGASLPSSASAPCGPVRRQKDLVDGLPDISMTRRVTV
jgi:hypothetical protein